MATLAEIRAKLRQQEQASNQGYGGDNAIYPHWNTPENETSIIRFLPDGDPNNIYFWVERQIINLQFQGVKGGESKPVTVKVPCVEMWPGMKCPIHEEIRPWFKDPNMEDLARKYWKKRSYLYQGFVVHSAFNEENKPENPIRRFIINTQIHSIIKSALMDPDFGDDSPTDYDMGVDFRITKTKKGQYADYSTSNWARKVRGLTQEERDAVEKYGLFNLQDYLPKKPSEKELNVIFEMFEASVNGEPYDPDRFADYYRPFGMEMPSSGPSVKTDTSEKADLESDVETVETDTVEQAKVQPTSSGSDAKPNARDILAAIRARNTAAQ